MTILYWRDIPAQIVVREGRRSAKRELPLRFTEAIDMCAMRTGAAETDAYLGEWRRGEAIDVSGDLETEADNALERIVREYDRQRLVQLVNQGGLEQ